MDVRDFMAGKLHMLQPKLVLVAFIAGVQYHDALAAYKARNGDKAGRIVMDQDLDDAFEVWHVAMAQALGVEPRLMEPLNPDGE